MMAARVAVAAASSAERVAVGIASRNPIFFSCELVHLPGHECEKASFTSNKLNMIQEFKLELGFRI